MNSHSVLHEQHMLRGAAIILFLTGLYTWVPFWVSAFLDHEPQWWRVPTVHGTMFDAPMYLTWVGYLQAGIPFANNIGWYKHVLMLLHTLTAKQASIAELWLLSAWLSSFLSALVTYLIAKYITRVETKTAALLSLTWWLSVSAHAGWRPGAYSWYLAPGLIAVAFMLHSSEIRSLIRRHIAWLIALALASMYPWFLIPIALWIGVEAVRCYAPHQKIMTGLWLLAVLASIGGGTIILQIWPTSIAHALEVFARYGLGFTRLPFVSTSVFTVIGWLTLLAVCYRSSSSKNSLTLSFLTGWLVTFFCFELSPFTGIVFQNDHFRAILLLLSWVSLFHVVASFSSWHPSKREQHLVGGLGIVSLLFILWKALRLWIHYYDDLSIIQVAYWLPLFGASTYLLLSKQRAKFPFVFLLLTLPFALIAASKVIRREIQAPVTLRERARLRDEITSHVPPLDQICANPTHADQLAPFIPRRIIPSVTYRFLDESEQVQLAFLRAYAHGWRGRTIIEREAQLKRLIAQDQYLPCDHLPRTQALLRRLGVSAERLDKITGCPRTHMQTALHTITTPFTNAEEGSRAFRAACPWVIVMPKEDTAWNIPPEAKKYSLSNGGTLVGLSQEP